MARQDAGERRSKTIGKSRVGRDEAASHNRMERRKNRGSGEVADWGTADSGAIVRAIRAVSTRGGALRFGYTRDGSAYATGIYDREESTTEYVRPSEDVNFYLAGLSEDFEA